MKKIFVLFSVIFLINKPFLKAQTQVTFYTTKGVFVAEMYDTLQPITAGNFLSLVNEKFYDGIIFHRVINGFMIQGGDPTGTGNGGPGYTIQDEFDSLTSNLWKNLAMANSGPNTGGSQFFINLVNNVYLNPNYPVFGKVTSGFNIVQAIGAVAKDANDRPLVDVVMDSVRVTFNPFAGITGIELNEKTIGVFPNPNSGNFTIYAGHNFAENNFYSLKITKLIGEIIYESKIREQSTNIDLQVGNGIYFVSLTDANKNTINKKVVVK